MNVSVIIPCYNVEEYIEKCILSILKNKDVDYEIVAINDGSKDQTLQVLEGLSKIYDNLKVIDIPNQGVSNARNVGIKHATGDYLLFVDSDDWITDDTISYLSDVCYKNNLDVLMFNYAEYYNETKIKECLFYKKDRMLDNLEAIKGILLDYYAPSVCNKMIRRKLLIENNISFLTSVKMGEDLLFSIALFRVSKQIMQVNKTCYYYLMRNDSVTHKVNDGVLTIQDSIKGIQEILKRYDLESLFKEEIDYLKFKHLFLYRVVLGPVEQPYHQFFYSEFNLKEFVKNRYYQQFKMNSSMSIKLRLCMYRYLPYPLALVIHKQLRRLAS